MAEKNWEVEIANIQGEIKLIQQKLDILENNHLSHIQRDIDRINKIMWFVGSMVFVQLIYALRSLIM
tara:strand:+ start:308 stop:508 length:201 start_codon:yes stop_codon:yes gene_type:complete